MLKNVHYKKVSPSLKLDTLKPEAIKRISLRCQERKYGLENNLEIFTGTEFFKQTLQLLLPVHCLSDIHLMHISPSSLSLTHRHAHTRTHTPTRTHPHASNRDFFPPRNQSTRENLKPGIHTKNLVKLIATKKLKLKKCTT